MIGWAGDVQAYDIGHLSIAAEEVVGAMGGDAPAGESLFERGDTGPLVGRIDQMGSAGIDESVDHLVEYVAGLAQVDDRGGLGGPEVLEAAEVGVLAAGQQTVEVLGKDGEVAVGVADSCVVVIAHRGRERDLDVRALGR